MRKTGGEKVQTCSGDRDKANAKSDARKETQEEMGLDRLQKASMRTLGGTQATEQSMESNPLTNTGNVPLKLG